MANYREMRDIAHDPERIRAIAKSLLAIPNGDWSDWEIDFLEKMAAWATKEPLSTRQSEKLVELRDGAEYVSFYQGFRVSTLIKLCWESRLDLSEDDEEFIDDLLEKKVSALKIGKLRRLIRCSRQLGIIDQLG